MGQSTSLLTWTIRGYQKMISRFLPPTCRFYPSCSKYTVGALQEHGMFYGSYLGFRRVLRCHPFHPGGYDPVPKRLKDSNG